ncbi:hypothetical protein [Microbacterium esteraromaticum]|uniref:hypothetical protein n=1 Tax=Microbacterium esteraromaticum TaxID=57043 RepID=UPI0019D34973|nr:hypothetical protein [Microbacterium esteraromaticum]MBN7792445.1 hypothetical protein [Microbacterium esteraromaticum]
MMQKEPRVVHSAAEVLDAGVNLESIQFFNLQAVINEETDGQANLPAEVTPVYGLKLRQEGNEIGTRVSIELDTGAARIIADASANYSTDELIELDEAAFLDFANNVGVMALLPYLRQAIADLSQRVLGDVILMPVIPRGGLVFSRADAMPPGFESATT